MLGYVDPCLGVPTISSVGTAAVNNGGDSSQCPTVNVVFQAAVTLSGSLPAGATLQARALWGSSPGVYTDQSAYADVSGWSGSSGNATASLTLDEYAFGVLGSTRYFRVDVRIIGTDGVTVCDQQDGSEGSSSNWNSC